MDDENFRMEQLILSLKDIKKVDDKIQEDLRKQVFEFKQAKTQAKTKAETKAKTQAKTQAEKPKDLKEEEEGTVGERAPLLQESYPPKKIYSKGGKTNKKIKSKRRHTKKRF